MKTISSAMLVAPGLLVAALGDVAWGNAFNVNEHEARVAGRGGATAASNTEASSIAFNPGGIPIGEGTQITLNSTLYFADGTFEPAVGPDVKTDNIPSFSPAAFGTIRLSDTVAVGLGIHSPFGLALSWPLENPQNQLVQDIRLMTAFITPAVGVNLNKWAPGLSIGGGLDIVPSYIELLRTVPLGDVAGFAKIGGWAVGIGGRAGVMYHPPAVPGLKLGVMYRSPVQLKFNGSADFDIEGPLRGALPPDGDMQTRLTLPQQVWGGVAYAGIPNLEVEANFVWINWSGTFKNDELRVDLPADMSVASPQDWSDTWTARLGAEYGIPSWNAAVRAGYIFDPTPISRRTLTAELPDAHRHDLTVGASYYFHSAAYAIHASFLWVIPSRRSTDDADPNMPFFKGDYRVTAYVPSLSVTGTFGRR